MLGLTLSPYYLLVIFVRVNKPPYFNYFLAKITYFPLLNLFMMKILHKSLVYTAFCFFSIFVSAQSNELIGIPEENIQAYIQEVYQEGDIPFNVSSPNRYRQLNTLLSERVFFMESEAVIAKALNVNDVELFNKYNATIQRDTQFNLETFNPLKYDLPFWTVSNSLYRLGNSSYYLVIKGQTFNK